MERRIGTRKLYRIFIIRVKFWNLSYHRVTEGFKWEKLKEYFRVHEGYVKRACESRETSEDL